MQDVKKIENISDEQLEKMMLEADLCVGYYLCFAGSALAFGAALEALRTHFPHAFEETPGVAPADAKKDGGG